MQKNSCILTKCYCLKTKMEYHYEFEGEGEFDIDLPGQAEEYEEFFESDLESLGDIEDDMANEVEKDLRLTKEEQDSAIINYFEERGIPLSEGELKNTILKELRRNENFSDFLNFKSSLTDILVHIGRKQARNHDSPIAKPKIIKNLSKAGSFETVDKDNFHPNEDLVDVALRHFEVAGKKSDKYYPYVSMRLFGKTYIPDFLDEVESLIKDIKETKNSQNDPSGFLYRLSEEIVNKKKDRNRFDAQYYKINVKGLPRLATVDYLLNNNSRNTAERVIKCSLKGGEDYARLLDSKVSGNLESYLDSINEDTDKRIKDLGIKLDSFKRGIEEKSFEVSETKARKAEDIVKRSKKELKKTLEDMLEKGVHAPKNLLLKIRDNLYNKKPFYGSQEKDIEQLMEEIGNDENKLRKAVSIAFEYANKKDRIKDKESLKVSRFHLRKILDRFNTSKDETLEGDIYKLRLCKKNPIDDLTIGNDGGACIGLYEHSAFDFERPLIIDYLSDNASQFIEVHRGDERVGFALVFAAESDDGPVFAINSLELSNKLQNESQEKLDMISKAALRYCIDYAKAAGFRHVALGDYEYNTSKNYGEKMARKVKQPDLELRKIGPDVYNEIFNDACLFIYSKKDNE